MWNRYQNHIENKKLDRFGAELLHAFDPSENEINTAAASPFLYRRIRVRIEAEAHRRLETRGKWFALLAEAKHAIPVLATIAVIAIGLLLYAPSRDTQTTTDPSRLMVIAEMPSVSSDEIIDSIVGWGERNSNERKER